MTEADYRSKCLEHHDEQCDACDSESNIEVHHITGDRTDNSLENLVPLCKSCHSKVHRDAPQPFSNNRVMALREQLLPREERSEKEGGDQVNTYYSIEEYLWIKKQAEERDATFSGVVREEIRRGMQTDKRVEA